jgi:hypothetical protein
MLFSILEKGKDIKPVNATKEEDDDDVSGGRSSLFDG